MIGLTTKTFALLILIMLTVQSYLVSCLCKLVVELWIWVTTRGIEPGWHWPWSNVHTTTPERPQGLCGEVGATVKLFTIWMTCPFALLRNEKFTSSKLLLHVLIQILDENHSNFGLIYIHEYKKKTSYSLNSLMHDIRHEFSVYKSARSFCTIRSIKSLVKSKHKNIR